MQSMMRATKIGIGFSFLIFLIIGIVSLYLYAFDTDDTILESFTDDMKYYRDDNVFIIVLIIIICITFIIACLTSFPILFLSLRVNFINSIIVCIKSCGRGTHSSQEVKISQSNNHKKRNYINNKAMVLITILLYFFIIATAIIIYRIRTVFTIVGITAGTFIAFILPNLFYIGIVKRSGKNYSLVLPFIFLGIGIFFFVWLTARLGINPVLKAVTRIISDSPIPYPRSTSSPRFSPSDSPLLRAKLRLSGKKTKFI